MQLILGFVEKIGEMRSFKASSPPPRYVKGSRMEDDSVISIAGMEEETSMISYNQFSAQRQAPIPAAPRAMAVIRRKQELERNKNNGSAGSNRRIVRAGRGQPPLRKHMSYVPGGKKGLESTTAHPTCRGRAYLELMLLIQTEGRSRRTHMRQV